MKIARVLIVVFVASIAACIESEPDDFGTQANATTPSGVSGAIVSRASITDVEVSIKWEDFKYKIDADSEDGTSVVMTIQQVTAIPGGHTGWHTHAGPTVAMITSGSVVVTLKRSSTSSG